MFRLFNRFAWILSFLSGFLLLFLLLGIVFGDDVFDEGFLLTLVFLSLFSGLMFKGIFLPKSFIARQCGIDSSKNLDERDAPLENNRQPLPQNLLLEQQKSDFVAPPKRVQAPPPPKPHKEKKYTHPPASQEPKTMLPPKPQKTEPNAIQRFFATNALAKVGGILLFLGVLFLLQLVYTQLGPVGKVAIGFGFGFLFYFTGVFLDKKKFESEGRILIGIGLLVNYLVILAGRYLIFDQYNDGLFSDGLSFFLLLLNTIFAITTAFVYQSNTLLFFAFAIAYINPFLIGFPYTDPYMICGYSLILSLGILALSYYAQSFFSDYSAVLFVSGFVCGNILVLVAPFSTEIEWIVKLACSAVFSFLVFYWVLNSDRQKFLNRYFILVYLFLILFLFQGSYILDSLNSSSVFYSYTLYFFLLFGIGIYFFLRTFVVSLVSLLFVPLLIFFGLFLGQQIPPTFFFPFFAGIVFVYLIGFFFLVPHLKIVLKTLYFIFLGLFMILFTIFVLPIVHSFSFEFSFVQALIVLCISFLFLLCGYWAASAKDSPHLYPLCTVFTPIMIFPLIEREGPLMSLSIFALVFYFVVHLITPFVSPSLLQKRSGLLLGLLGGLLFIVIELFYFGKMYFDGTVLGLSFFGLAVLYFILSFFFLEQKSLVFEKPTEQQKTEADFIYALLGISVSLFSLSIAYLFQSSPEIIAFVWLFESTLLYFFYTRLKDIKVFVAGLLLMLIGLIKLFSFASIIASGNYFALVPIALLFVFFFVNIRFLQQAPLGGRIIHDILHLVGIGLLTFLVVEIFDVANDNELLFFIFSILAFVLACVYGAFQSRMFLRTLFFVFVVVLFLVNMSLVNHTQSSFSSGYILSTLVLILSVLFFRILSKSLVSRVLQACMYWLALFTLTFYCYYTFSENIFSVTLFWGIVAFIALMIGITQEYKSFRTFGLYVISLTVLKIVFFDIWEGLDNAVMRIVALILVGALMIGISLLYTKKYHGDMKGEFQFHNMLE